MRTIRRGPGTWTLCKTVFVVSAIYGLGFAGATDPARSIGGLCNGQLASHPSLDASYQPGPAILEGTLGDDVIIGSQGGRDRIDGNGGNDVVCGGPGGYNSITVGPGNAVVFGGGGHERITGIGPGNFTFVGGPLGHNTLMHRGGRAILYGGAGGNNTLIHAGPSDGNFDKMDGGFTSRGRVLAFGDAEFYGDLAATTVNAPVVRSAATPDGRGYSMVASDGGVFSFGNAPYLGSMADRRLHRPVRSLVPTPAGAGYWLVASDGGVFAFGDAPFRGIPGQPCPQRACDRDGPLRQRIPARGRRRRRLQLLGPTPRAASATTPRPTRWCRSPVSTHRPAPA
jgi:hypothetical protein